MKSKIQWETNPTAPARPARAKAQWEPDVVKAPAKKLPNRRAQKKRPNPEFLEDYSNLPQFYGSSRKMFVSESNPDVGDIFLINAERVFIDTYIVTRFGHSHSLLVPATSAGNLGGYYKSFTQNVLGTYMGMVKVIVKINKHLKGEQSFGTLLAGDEVFYIHPALVDELMKNRI